MVLFRRKSLQSRPECRTKRYAEIDELNIYMSVHTLNVFSLIFFLFVCFVCVCYVPKELLQAGEDKKLLTGECYVLKVTFMKELLNLSSKSTMALLPDVHCGFSDILWKEHMYCGPMKNNPLNPISAHQALFSPVFKISGKNYISMQYYCSICPQLILTTVRIYVDIHSLTSRCYAK